MRHLAVISLSEIYRSLLFVSIFREHLSHLFNCPNDDVSRFPPDCHPCFLDELVHTNFIRTQNRRIWSKRVPEESRKKAKKPPKRNTNQCACAEMAVPEPNNPYVITMAHIDRTLRTVHADSHTDWQIDCRETTRRRNTAIERGVSNAIRKRRKKEVKNKSGQSVRKSRWFSLYETKSFKWFSTHACLTKGSRR